MKDENKEKRERIVFLYLSLTLLNAGYLIIQSGGQKIFFFFANDGDEDDGVGIPRQLPATLVLIASGMSPDATTNFDATRTKTHTHKK